jgi:hypothetical protein
VVRSTQKGEFWKASPRKEKKNQLQSLQKGANVSIFNISAETICVFPQVMDSCAKNLS